MTSLPSLLYSEVDDEIRSTVRAVLTDRSDWRAVLARTESDEPYDLDLWRLLTVELGFGSLSMPEDVGGSGQSFAAVAVVIEELGRAVAAVPFMGSAVLASSAAAAAGDVAVLEQMAAGERVAALAVSYATPPDAPFPTGFRADDGRVSGSARAVVDAEVANLLVVPAMDPDGAGLYAIDVPAGAVSPVGTLDLTRRVADVSLQDVPGRRIAAGPAAEQSLHDALLTGAALLASEQLGVAERCLEMTIEYVKGRYQFGRPVGSFQAVKHRLADLWVSVAQARAVARYAAACLTGDREEAAVAAALAQAYCSRVAIQAAEECVQLHGGIGFTWEHPAHLLLKRARSSVAALGSPERHRTSIGLLMDLPPPVPEHG